MIDYDQCSHTKERGECHRLRCCRRRSQIGSQGGSLGKISLICDNFDFWYGIEDFSGLGRILMLTLVKIEINLDTPVT